MELRYGGLIVASNTRKVISYRRPLKLNIGTIIFLILFIYLLFSISSYLGRKKIRFYEVQTGEMVDDKELTGLILRTEHVQTAPSSGYVNYYIRDGKRAAVGTRIYSLDETGNLKKYLEESEDQKEALSEQNLKELKTKLSLFSAGFRSDQFKEVYNSLESLRSILSEYTSIHLLDQLDETLKAQGISLMQGTSPESAVVSFNMDSYEEKTAEQLTANDFRPESYKPVYIGSGSLVEKGAPVYKTIPSEDWQLVFPMTEKIQKELSEYNSLRIAFPAYDLTISGDYSQIKGEDGTTFGMLTFHQYMVRFLNDRYIQFQIYAGREDGLKIPRSSLTKKRFYVVPKNYLTNGGNGVEEGFLKEVPEGAETKAVFMTAEIFYANDTTCYLDSSDTAEFHAGDYLIAPQSGERFQIGETAELQGVYNINKGFAVFKQIDIIDENEEYITIKRGTRYGLNVYDHILLNGEEGKEGQQVYQ